MDVKKPNSPSSSSQGEGERRFSINLSRFNKRKASTESLTPTESKVVSTSASQVTSDTSNSNASKILHLNRSKSNVETKPQESTSVQSKDIASATEDKAALKSTASVTTTSQAVVQTTTKDSTLDKVNQSTSAKSQSTSKTAPKTSTTNQSKAKDNSKGSTKAVSEQKEARKETKGGNKNPPWMAQYQQDTNESSSNNAQQQSNAVQANTITNTDNTNLFTLSAKGKLSKEELNRLFDVYNIHNSFDLSMLSLQNDFDSLDEMLDQAFDSHQDLHSNYVKHNFIPKFDSLQLTDESLELLTTKKGKSKNKDILTKRLDKAIVDYLHFKYRGVFKSVYMYQVFCESFRKKLFEQLEKQCLTYCRSYARSNNDIAMDELQQMLDKIEPLDVAANKLLRITMAETSNQLITSFLQTIKNRPLFANNTGRFADDAPLKRTCTSIYRVLEEVKGYEFFDFDDLTLPEKFDPNPQDNSHGALQNITALVNQFSNDNNWPFGAQNQESLERVLQSYGRRNEDVVSCSADVNNLNKVLFGFDNQNAYTNFLTNTLFDSCKLNPGSVWLNQLHNFVNESKIFFQQVKADEIAYIRFVYLLQCMEQGQKLSIIDAEKCVNNDHLFINNCASGNFTRNMSHLSLMFRQLVALRKSLYIYNESRLYRCEDPEICLHESAGALSENSFASVVRFILNLNKSERFIFNELLDKKNSDNLIQVLSEDFCASVNVAISKQKDLDPVDIDEVVQFCMKLTNTTLVQRISHQDSSVSRPNNYSCTLRVLPVLADNIENTKRMLRMFAMVQSLDKRMTQELQYINPMLRTLFECAETIARNTTTSADYMSRLQEAIHDELKFNQACNQYLKKYNSSSKKISSEDEDNMSSNFYLK